MSNVSLIDGHLDNAEHCVCCGQVIPEGRQHCVICGYKVENGKQRQIDRIRNMSVEELAKQIAIHIGCTVCPCNENCKADYSCEEVIKQWLESEVTE